MAADPWNAATPTNANTVKTTTPDELQALKTVNLQRQRFWGNGITAAPSYNFVGGGPWTSEQPLFFNSTLLTIGAYDVLTGEYTVDKTGYYRVAAKAGRLASVLGGTVTYEELHIQKFVAAVWSTFGVDAVPGSAYLSNVSRINLMAEAIVSLTAGDKIRATHFATATTNLGAAAHYPAFSGGDFYLGIEFLRTP